MMIKMMNKIIYLIVILNLFGIDYLPGQDLNSDLEAKKIKYRPGFRSVNSYYIPIIFIGAYGFSVDYDFFKNNTKTPVSYGIRVGLNHIWHDDPAGGLLSGFINKSELMDYNILFRRTDQGKRVRLDLCAGYTYVVSRSEGLFSESEDKYYFHLMELGFDFKFKIIKNSFGIVVKGLGYIRNLNDKSFYVSLGFFLDVGSLSPEIKK